MHQRNDRVASSENGCFFFAGDYENQNRPILGAGDDYILDPFKRSTFDNICKTLLEMKILILILF